jgi:hypothetical protein
VLTSGGYSVSASDGDFLGTLRFVGLSLTDMNGIPVDFTIDSASGARYTDAGIAPPVPEPATAGLWAVALVVQAVGVCWRRRQSAA